MVKQCSQCKSESFVTLFVNHDYISGQNFNIVKCNQCHLVRTFIPENIDLASYYAQEYYGNENHRFNHFMELAIVAFRKRRTALIQRLHPTVGAVLDVGCGRGLMLDLLRKAGWEVQGVEYSTQAAVYASESLKLPVQIVKQLTDGHFSDQQFDLVTFWHVFEHLTDPVATLQEIFRIVKPGGLAIIEVPNQSSWQAKIGQGAWFHLDAPRHLYHFSKETLEKMTEANRFTVVKLSTWSLEMGFYGMIQSILNRLLGSQNVLYTLLKNRSARKPKQQKIFWDVGIHLVLLGPVVLIGVPLELIATLLGGGGVVRIVVKKPNA